MPTPGGATIASDLSSKPQKAKSREVSSRFLSPTSSSSINSYSSREQYANQSPKSTLSPIRQKPRSSTDSRKHKSLENSGFLSGLWPASSSSKSKPDTLADHLGNDRRKDMHEEERRNKLEKIHQNSSILNRQRSWTEFSRFENEKKIYTSAKENHKPIIGGSMRYAGKFKFHKKSSQSSSNSLDDPGDDIAPGRFSVDENALRKKSSFSARGLSDSDTQDSESEYSDICSGDILVAGKNSPASYMAPTVSSRKQGIGVPSKFMHSLSSRYSRRWSTSDNPGLINHKPSSSDNNNNNSNNSPNFLNSRKSNGNWSLSPGRSKIIGLTNSKPPSSPSRGKGVGNILSIGIELLKGKKCSSSSVSSPLGPGSAENVHQLRLLHNGLMQWRYCNARTEAANGNAINQVESNFLYVWKGLITLRHSVLQKKLQLQKEKLEMKLNYILHSQIKGLEIWGNMEKQHISSVSATNDYLHSVVCKIPLVEGAKVDPQSASFVVRHATDLASSINLTLTTFSLETEKAVGVMAEVAMVVSQEKLLLEECFELFRNIIALEVQERSLQSSIMQLKLLHQQHNHQQQYILAT